MAYKIIVSENGTIAENVHLSWGTVDIVPTMYVDMSLGLSARYETEYGEEVSTISINLNDYDVLAMDPQTEIALDHDLSKEDQIAIAKAIVGVDDWESYTRKVDYGFVRNNLALTNLDLSEYQAWFEEFILSK